MADRVGQQLGNYQLMRLLGQGGFAHVYLGEHIYLKTLAAIKVLHGQMTAQDLQNFMKEAQMVALLKHPHIVRVLDFGIEGTTPFLAMDYAQHGTLRRLHKQGNPIPLSTIVSYVMQIGSALQYAHDQGKVHRDVKPENMLVEPTGSVLLSDFGIAIAAHKTQSLNTQDAIGTVTYMAPEQIRGKARPASDQYSLAITAYEWLSGTLPFDGSTPIEIAMSHLSDPPLSLQTKIPTIPSAVDQVVLQALAKDPQQRFANIQTFAEALERASQGITTPSASPTVPVSRPNISSQSGPILAATTPAALPAKAPQVMYKSAKGTLFYTQKIHTRPVRTVAWSPDGRHIASGGNDKTVQIWDAQTSKIHMTYRGHFTRFKEGAVYTIAWSPDGTQIASGGTDGVVCVWDAHTGKNIYTYRGHSDVIGAVAWSPNGTQIASASKDKTVHIWNVGVKGPALVLRDHSAFVYTVTWSPNGMYVASGSQDRTVLAWDITTGNDLFNNTFSAAIGSVAWSPDGTRLACAGLDKMVHILDTTTARELYTYQGHSEEVYTVRWSPDGAYIASGGLDTKTQIWSPTTGKPLLTYRGHSEGIVAVDWSPDGMRLASGSLDATVQVWQAI